MNDALERACLEIAQASHILFALNVLDAFGHVSCRSPERSDHFLMSRNRAPALVESLDVIEHDLDGQPISQPDARVFLERFIHGEIYRARPDVRAVVHSHCLSVLPFTVVADARLRPISHVCGFLADVGRPFDVADHDGDATDLLIRDSRLGRALASHLGSSKIVLMRGHGFTAVGETVAQAVYRAVYTGVNSQIQLAAGQLGTPRFLSAGEAAAGERSVLSQINRVWELWVWMYGGGEVGGGP